MWHLDRFCDRIITRVGRGGGIALIVCAYIGGLALAGWLAIYGVHRLAVLAADKGRPLLTADLSGQPQGGAAVTVVTGSGVLADDNWSALINSERYWQSGRRGRDSGTGDRSQSSRSSLDDDDDDERERPASRSKWSSSGGSSRVYRTVCVRPCDGYYFPISFRTHGDDLHRDAATCARSCTGGRLYIHNDPADTDALVDLQGRPYSSLKTAFLYRTKYDAACKCKPHAWEQAELDRHKKYALAARIRKGDRTAIAQLRALNDKRRAAAFVARATAMAAAAKRAPVSAAVLSSASTNPTASATVAAVKPQQGAAQPASAVDATGSVAPTVAAGPIAASYLAPGRYGLAGAGGVGSGVPAPRDGMTPLVAASPGSEVEEEEPRARTRSRSQRSRNSYASRHGNVMRLGARRAATPRQHSCIPLGSGLGQARIRP